MGLNNSEPVRWSPDGQVCIVDGKGYMVNRHGETVCIGMVDQNGKKSVTETSQNPSQNPQDAAEPVSKFIDVNSYGDNGSHDETGVIMKQPEKRGRGRPPKTGDDISRTTRWRREQSGQLRLV